MAQYQLGNNDAFLEFKSESVWYTVGCVQSKNESNVATTDVKTGSCASNNTGVAETVVKGIARTIDASGECESTTLSRLRDEILKMETIDFRTRRHGESAYVQFVGTVTSYNLTFPTDEEEAATFSLAISVSADGYS